MAMPSLVLYHRGQEVDRLVGAWPRAKIAAMVDRVVAPSRV
jgi:thioredoxin-like negative regulator of GroEL